MGKKHILFSGGGSGGHVIPARTLIQELQGNSDIQISYIGSTKGIERKVMRDIGVSYSPIRTGKLRRYLSVQNLLDVFNIILGISQSLLILLKNRPKLIVLTGGFVIVPVAVAAFLLRIPMVLHEQTTRIGLANKLASYLVKKVMISFPSSAQFLPKDKTMLTGYPVRDILFSAQTPNSKVQEVNLDEITKPILFVTGGGNGSELLNQFVRSHFERLTEKYFVFHQTGRDHVEKYKDLDSTNYMPLGFMGDEYIEILKRSACIVSRSGAGTVAELLAIGKSSIYVPLKIAQKNEQYHNAMEAHDLLESIVISEDDFDNEQAVLEQVLAFEMKTKKPISLEENPKNKIINFLTEELNS
jgi:UDP-N-acetylglucosamine--N-acetylmuramyl-(pentapeptide) pyrophosphoryl-undecaprenol N-acetylglucosamine transferase